MPRYVDIDKTYEIARIYHKDFARSMADLTSLREVLEDALEDTPTGDVVEVVRCKECKYFFDNQCYHSDNRVAYKVPDFGKHYVYKAGTRVESDHFCSYGTKRGVK